MYKVAKRLAAGETLKHQLCPTQSQSSLRRPHTRTAHTSLSQHAHAPLCTAASSRTPPSPAAPVLPSHSALSAPGLAVKSFAASHSIGSGHNSASPAHACQASGLSASEQPQVHSYFRLPLTVASRSCRDSRVIPPSPSVPSEGLRAIPHACKHPLQSALYLTSLPALEVRATLVLLLPPPSSRARRPLITVASATSPGCVASLQITRTS